ncbi:MAG: CehA/McbA family metallohydrolase [Proteobacteria bacterium]|nr:CehA/McbA family metallohydrolase [Pseudomonadota bacterium]
MKQPDKWLLDGVGYGRLPAVCADAQGRWWVVYIMWNGRGERVEARYKEPEEKWSAPMSVSDTRPLIGDVSVTPWKGGVLAAWVDGNDPEADGVKLKEFSATGEGKIGLVASCGQVPAHVSLSADETVFTLAWTVRKKADRVLMACSGDAVDRLCEPVEISPGDGFDLRPAVVQSPAGAVIVWQRMSRGISKMLTCRFGRDGVVSKIVQIIGDGQTIYAVPSACLAGDGGCWIGWQSDSDPAGSPGLVRWIEIHHISKDGVIQSPSAPMPGVNRQGEGEDQGFESPSIACFADGHLAVIGRGSQSVCRQDLGSAGWTERTQIDESGWRCRGRRFDAFPVAEGILVAGREQAGIVVRFLPKGDGSLGGEPKLSPPVESVVPDTISRLDPRRGHMVDGKPVLFGDIHQHTAGSDGTGTMEETYFRARYRYRDDIVAVADHEGFLGKRTAPGEWAESCRTASEFNESGKFIVLQAFEWTGEMHPGPGHKIVYLPSDGGPVLSREDPDTSTARGLIAESRKRGAIVVPHHVGWTGANMGDHEPEVQTCWEIVSCHGAYERQGASPIGTRGDDKEGQFVTDALDAGLRFGFVGGSDGHGLNWHHGVCRVQDSHRSGLTAVFSNDVTVDGVLDAIKRRRCYATSGAKIGLWFEVDGRPMGEELVIGGSVQFRVVVSGTNPIESLVLVTNGGEETALDAYGKEVNINGNLPPPPGGGWCYYFIRVVQTDGEVAWSSPIWMDSPDSA